MIDSKTRVSETKERHFGTVVFKDWCGSNMQVNASGQYATSQKKEGNEDELTVLTQKKKKTVNGIFDPERDVFSPHNGSFQM